MAAKNKYRIRQLLFKVSDMKSVTGGKFYQVVNNRRRFLILGAFGVTNTQLSAGIGTDDNSISNGGVTESAFSIGFSPAFK